MLCNLQNKSQKDLIAGTQDTIDTIVAQATPAGFGGIGIVRVSGALVPHIALKLLKKLPNPKQAEYLPFLNTSGEILDEGIALYFKAPHSFTGEDVLELQGHGGPMVIQRVIREVVGLGARMARPGEFSERAVLNDKLDLVQAEAILDLIHANSEQAARSAIRSLQGDFSNQVREFTEQVIYLRMHVEAQIDFPEEEIASHAQDKIRGTLEELITKLEKIFKNAKTGALLSEGAKVVILGRPNAGKSSLLNNLAGMETAIVTDIPGTTRDVLKEKINLDGLILHIVDTAGLRKSNDPIEQEGIKRAVGELQKADHILLMVDASTTSETDPFLLFPEYRKEFVENIPMTVIMNKIDKLNLSPLCEIKELVCEQRTEPATKSQLERPRDYTIVQTSMKTKIGLELLKNHLKDSFQFSQGTEDTFTARARHVKALEEAKHHLLLAKQQLEPIIAYELMAEELRLCQRSLDEVTGKFTSDDLLGKIFSEFCIGK